MPRDARAFWARQDAARARREHDPATCAECNPRGLATDAVMARLAAHQKAMGIYVEVVEDWDSFEPNTYGGD